MNKKALGLARFSEYASSYGKTYSTIDEWERRAEIFMENDKLIREWNLSGESSTILGHNKFSDWEDHEYRNLLTHKSEPDTAKLASNSFYDPISLSSHRNIVYGSVDWRNSEAVGPVKN